MLVFSVMENVLMDYANAEKAMEEQIAQLFFAKTTVTAKEIVLMENVNVLMDSLGNNVKNDSVPMIVLLEERY